MNPNHRWYRGSVYKSLRHRDSLETEIRSGADMREACTPGMNRKRVVGGEWASFGGHQWTRTSVSCRKRAVRGGWSGRRKGGSDIDWRHIWIQSATGSSATTRSMSRVPFESQPTSRRTRTPSISSPLPNPLNYPATLAATRPLQIARPPSRSSTPSNAAFSSSSPAFSSPNRPHRPQRSDLRPRQPSDYSASERTSTSSRIVNDLNARERRDSSSTTLSDASIQHRPIGSISLPTKPRLDHPHPTTSELPGSPFSSTTPSPALSVAMAAFRDAGEASFRRRELPNGNDEGNYELDRRLEVERERARQDRIKERMPYRKPTAKTQTGGIDGQSKTLILYGPRHASTIY